MASVDFDIEASIATITLRRPERGNSLDDGMIDAFVDAAAEVAAAEPRAVIVTGAGEKCFCAGYDMACIDPHQPLTEPLPDERFERAVLALTALEAPTIAAMNGDAFGGGLDLAVACDFRLVREDARLGMTSCKLGLVFAPSGIARFLRAVGPRTTRRLFLTALPVDAGEALELGLVDEVLPSDRIAGRARELGRAIAELPPLAVRGTARTIRELEAASLPAEVSEELAALRLEAFSTGELENRLRELLTAKRGRR